VEWVFAHGARQFVRRDLVHLLFDFTGHVRPPEGIQGAIGAA
jgi:hypothetical protein